MGSIGGIKYSSLEMFRISSSVNDQIVDHIQYVAGGINEIRNEKCLGDKFASVKNLSTESSRAFHCPVPKRPRTPRVVVEKQTYNFEEGVYYCCDQMIVDEKDSSPSDKHSSDEDLIVSVDDNVDLMVSDDANVDLMVSDDGHQDFVVSDDDYKLEESCRMKRQKKVERNPRKPVPVYNLPSDDQLPQNLQEYINGLNLEAPPLFVAKKLLTVTDVTPQQSRLLLPRSLINPDFFYSSFLTEEEKEMLETEAIEVNLVDDKLRVFDNLRMKRWVKDSPNDYVLQKVWNKVAKENNLEPLKVSKDSKDKIAAMKDGDLWKTDVVALVWCFRRESKIWLAFHTQAMSELDILGVKEDNKGNRYIISVMQ